MKHTMCVMKNILGGIYNRLGTREDKISVVQGSNRNNLKESTESKKPKKKNPTPKYSTMLHGTVSSNLIYG